MSLVFVESRVQDYIASTKRLLNICRWLKKQAALHKHFRALGVRLSDCFPDLRKRVERTKTLCDDEMTALETKIKEIRTARRHAEVSDLRRRSKQWLNAEAFNHHEKETQAYDAVFRFKDCIGMPLMQRPKVFISYARRNKDFVYDLARALEIREIDVWYDEDRLLCGDDLPKSIKRNIHKSDFLLLVYSPAAKKSDWVRREIAYAKWLIRSLGPDGIKILPIRYRRCKIAGLVGKPTHIDFTKRNKFPESFSKLLDSLQWKPSISFGGADKEVRRHRGAG